MGLGLAWLAVSTVLLAAAPGLLAIAHTAPQVIALTHAWVLGVFVTIATGAIYQLAPVALGTTLWSERGGWAHFALHACGVPGMVYAFWHWDLPLLEGSASLVVAGVLLFAANTLQTVRRSGKRDAVAASLALSSLWLSATVLFGLTLVSDRLWHFWPADTLALLRAHAHLGLVGFFVTLLQGVSFRLIPMFTLGEVPDWRPVRAGLWCSQLGLLALAPALAFGAGHIATMAGALILAGMACSGWALRQTLATRKKQELDPGVSTFLRGLAGLPVACLAGLLLVWPTTPWNSTPGGYSAMVYALIVVAGGLLPAIAGMLCKIVPFLTWMRAYGPKVGRGPTPSAGSLTRPRLERWAFAIQGIALLPLLAGAWLLNFAMLRVGAALLAIGTGLFLADMIGVLAHLWHPVSIKRPATVPAFPPPATPARPGPTVPGPESRNSSTS